MAFVTQLRGKFRPYLGIPSPRIVVPGTRTQREGMDSVSDWGRGALWTCPDLVSPASPISDPTEPHSLGFDPKLKRTTSPQAQELNHSIAEIRG